MYPLRFLVTDEGCLEYVEDEDVLDNVMDRDEEEENEVVEKNKDVAVDISGRKFIPCDTTSKTVLNSKTAANTKNQTRNRILFLYLPKSLTKYHNHLTKTKLIPTVSNTSSNLIRQKNQCTLHIQPKLHLFMYKKQTSKNYLLEDSRDCMACRD